MNVGSTGEVLIAYIILITKCGGKRTVKHKNTEQRMMLKRITGKIG
jgi:hypothetical protein